MNKTNSQPPIKIFFLTFSAPKDEKLRESDPIQHAMGSFGKWHLFICLAIFLLKFPVAWHQVKHWTTITREQFSSNDNYFQLSIIFLAPSLNFSCANSSIPKCSDECNAYDYDRSIFTETIKTTWNLVCEREHWANFSQMVFMSGILVGSVVFGTLSDK